MGVSNHKRRVMLSAGTIALTLSSPLLPITTQARADDPFSSTTVLNSSDYRSIAIWDEPTTAVDENGDVVDFSYVDTTEMDEASEADDDTLIGPDNGDDIYTPPDAATTANVSGLNPQISDAAANPIRNAPPCDANHINVVRRYGQCVFVTNGRVVYYYKGDEVGHVALTFKRQLSLNQLSNTFAEHDTFHVKEVVKAGVGTELMKFVVKCGGTCSAHVKNFEGRVLEVGDTFTADVDYKDTTKGRNPTKSTYTLIFNNPIYGENAPEVYSAPYRCDSEMKNQRPGCVFYHVLETVSMTSLKEIDANVKRIQAEGPHHYGSKSLSGGKNPLTRNTSKALQKANRDIACPASRPRPNPDTWCDEYPFASSNQGAALTKRPDWDWDWVPASEQRSQGTKINTFNRKYRILKNDTYWVD